MKGDDLQLTGSAFDPETGELFPEMATTIEDWIEQKIKPVAESVAVQPPASELASEKVADPNPEPLGGRSLDEALFRAQAELPNWVKAEKVGARGKYAPLGMILAVVRPVFAAHGLRIRQGADRSWPMDEGGGSKGRLVPVWTEIIHTPSGERERTTLEMPLPKTDPQGMGSAITYGRRYSLLAAIGLASDEADDDGARAKRQDVTEAQDESAALISLKAEVTAVKDLAGLVKWAAEAKVKRAIDDLSEGDAVLLRQHWAQRKRDLLDGVDEPPAEAPAAPAKRKSKEPAA
jgi:hypothetical protein